MQPTYKKIQTIKPHCSICGEVLQGNGSIMLPYICSCGTWKWKYRGNDTELELELKKKGYK